EAQVTGLAHLVDDAAVRAALLAELRGREELVELVGECRTATAEQLGQAPTVVGRREELVPAVRHGVVIVVAPYARVVLLGRGRPLTLSGPALEEARRGVEQVDVLLRAAEEVLGLLVEPSALVLGRGRVLRHGLGHPRDGEVVHRPVLGPGERRAA